MMIGSYIRKNKTDRRLSRYLKEMANVRKRERQQQLLNATVKAATITESNKVKIEKADTSKSGQDDKKKIPHLKAARPQKLLWPQQLYTDRVYLDMPPSGYICNSDSDNDTSTEGDALVRFSPATNQKSSPLPKPSQQKTRSKSVTLKLPSDKGVDISNEPSAGVSEERVNTWEVRRDSECSVDVPDNDSEKPVDSAKSLKNEIQVISTV